MLAGPSTGDSMSITDPHAPTNTDRIALSNQLYELAESFALEATLWKADQAKLNLARSGRQLAEVARQLLSRRADFAKAQAFADAATSIYRSVVACRRFLTSTLAEPTRGAQR